MVALLIGFYDKQNDKLLVRIKMCDHFNNYIKELWSILYRS